MLSKTLERYTIHEKIFPYSYLLDLCTKNTISKLNFHSGQWSHGSDKSELSSVLYKLDWLFITWSDRWTVDYTHIQHLDTTLQVRTGQDGYRQVDTGLSHRRQWPLTICTTT